MNKYIFAYYHKVIIVLFFTLLTSCVAFKLPPKLNATGNNILIVKNYALTVGVVKYKLPIYSYQLAKVLESANIFSSVKNARFMDGSCDLYIEIIKHEYDDDLSGAAFILNGFGLFPYVDKHFYEGCKIAIYDSNGVEINTCLDLTLDQKAIMWLCAPLIALSPEWSLRKPVNTNLYTDNVKTILSNTLYIYYDINSEKASNSML